MNQASEEEHQASLEQRANENARTIPGWNVAKQRRYEDFLAAEKAEEARRRADLETTREMEKAFAAALPKTERVPDPWEKILSEIERMPNVSGALERGNGYLKVSSKFLLQKVLGISEEKVNHTHTIRLASVMECLGWEKPPNIRVGERAAKGYRKSLEG